MVRRKLIQSAAAAAVRSVLATQPAPIASVRPALVLQTQPTHPDPTSTSTSSSAAPNLKYIDERVNNVFNIILAEINHKNTHPALALESHHSPSAIYRDPYNFKDRILVDLVSNTDITTNYNIHDLIEEEFGLEISDREFARFKSLGDIVKYVNERLEIRQSLFPHGDAGSSNSNLTY